MRKSLLKLYAPFLALALVQAAFIAFAPSKGPSNEFTAGSFDPDAGGELGSASSGGASTSESTASFEADGGASAAGGNASDGGGGGGDAGGGGGGGDAGGGSGTTAPGGGGAAAGGGQMDRSICKGEFQFDILHVNPRCVGKWPGGDNGGATYQGVTDKEIKVIVFSSEPNAAVNAVLAPQGLAATEQELEQMNWAITKFINENYELYGRKVVSKRVVGDCPTTPPDYTKCRAAIQQVIKEKPFIVVWGTPLYAEIFDEMARAGIVGLGGWHFDATYFNGRRPFRYDIMMDGTQSADMIAEFYCKNLAGKNASHSGRIIHPDIGQRGQVKRKLGVITPEIDANVRTAKHLLGKVEACGGGNGIFITYESDIERANEQAQTTTQKLIAADVTTVVCMCDPIAPAFGSKYYTRNGYFPEILSSGMGFSDYDKVGRLYDERQMAHAFGLSHLAEPYPFEDQDSNRVWRASGADEEFGRSTSCQSCGVPWGYGSLLGSLLMYAGPNLNPQTMERAMLTSPGWGGHVPEITLVKFGADDYTAISDVRLTYWDSTARSKVDGNPGAYVGIDGGRRYPMGSIPDNVMSKVPVRE